MSEPEGQKHLQARTTHGSWLASIWSSGLAVICFSPLMISKFNVRNGWDVTTLSILVLAVLANAVRVLYLLRARRRDAPFWKEEEARRAEWDRRGRSL